MASPPSPLPFVRTAVALLAGGLVAGLFGGCVSLRPVEAVRDELGTGELVELEHGTVHYLDEGAGTPTLLVHGFGASVHGWRAMVPALARQRRVVAPDLYGFGLSDRPEQLSAYTRQGQVELLLGLLDHLGIARADLVGHSYGGGLVTTLAVLHPERVRSLTLVASTAPDWANQRRSALASFPPLPWLFVRALALRRGNVRQALERSYHDDSLVDETLVDAYRRRLRVEGVARAYRGLTAAGGELVTGPAIRLSEIAVPTLVIWGEEDRVLDVAAGREASGRIAGARFVALEGCGHVPQVERPEATLAALLRFWAEVEAGAG